jgi:hypothetical protein
MSTKGHRRRRFRGRREQRIGQPCAVLVERQAQRAGRELLLVFPVVAGVGDLVGQVPGADLEPLRLRAGDLVRVGVLADTRPAPLVRELGGDRGEQAADPRGFCEPQIEDPVQEPAELMPLDLDGLGVDLAVEVAGREVGAASCRARRS